MSALAYSVVVPVFNESAALPGLLAEIIATMDSLGRPYECVFVDDGSTDGTAELLDALARRPGSPLRPLHFPTNRGQAAALYVGVNHAQGDVIVTLDGDAQNCPADIPALLAFLDRERLDLVCGIRRERQDSSLRRRMSRFANRVRARVLGDRTSDSGCGLKVMRRAVVPSLLPLRTLYSFVPALAVAAGFTVGEHPVTHRQRHGGRSSYGLRAMAWYPFVDMLGVAWYQRRCVLEPSDRATEASGATEHDGQVVGGHAHALDEAEATGAGTGHDRLEIAHAPRGVLGA
jgi:glycosyltransferase involved in cell wall biosynthesis